MKKIHLVFIIAIVAMLLIAGCSDKEYAPVPIEEGVDRCVVCNMMVADDQHATEIILKNGKPLKFDDLGDMFVWTTRNGLDDVAVQYVRDYHTMEWIKLEDASFVYDKNNKTPMAFGVYSFADKADAEKFISEMKAGQLMTSEDLEKHHWERNMEMMKEMMKKKHGMMEKDEMGTEDDMDSHMESDMDQMEADMEMETEMESEMEQAE